MGIGVLYPRVISLLTINDWPFNDKQTLRSPFIHQLLECVHERRMLVSFLSVIFHLKIEMNEQNGNCFAHFSPS